MFTDENGKALELAAQGGYTYRLVRDTDDPTGATYAFGPGVFYWVTSDQHLAYLRQTHLVSPDDKDVLTVNHDLIGLIRQECGRGVEGVKDLPPQAETAWYEVKPGDTLSGIAADYGIPDWHTIATLNGITDPQSIQPGQKIRVK